MSIASFAPSQQPQHFDENANASTSPVYLYNGALYLITQDVVGSLASGGSTSRFFIYKSSDQGNTWSDITPAAPVKLGSAIGQMFVRSGNVVYFTNIGNFGGGGKGLNFLGFDLASESWIADGPQVQISTTTISNTGIQCLARASDGAIVTCYARAADKKVLVAVYDPVGVLWVLSPTVVTGADISQVCSGGVSSTDVAHFFVCQWSGASYGSGSATLQHFTVDASNTVSAVALAYTFTNIPDTQFPWVDVGEPAFYLDVTPATRKIAIPIGTRSNAAPFTGNITGLVLLIATEADAPVWGAPVSVPTGENFSQVTLANSQVTAMFVASLLPIQFSGQTQLHIFWTSNGQAIQAVGANWNNFLRHLDYTDGVFSGVTTEFSETNETMPGALYPILVSLSGNTAEVGGFFPTIDFLQFTSPAVKYDSLQLWWMSFTAAGSGTPLALDCNNPPAGEISVPYNHSLSASGGAAPYTFALTGGALPPGLTLNAATGTVSGTPTVFGVYSFTVQVTDSAAATASVTCSISIAQILIGMGGGAGCIPKCSDLSARCLSIEDMEAENRGGDPAVLFTILAALALMEVAE